MELFYFQAHNIWVFEVKPTPPPQEEEEEREEEEAEVKQEHEDIKEEEDEEKEEDGPPKKKRRGRTEFFCDLCQKLCRDRYAYRKHMLAHETGTARGPNNATLIRAGLDPSEVCLRFFILLASKSANKAKRYLWEKKTI